MLATTDNTIFVYHVTRKAIQSGKFSFDGSVYNYPQDYELVATIEVNTDSVPDSSMRDLRGALLDSTWIATQNLDTAWGDGQQRSSMVGDIFRTAWGEKYRVAGDGFRRVTDVGLRNRIGVTFFDYRFRAEHTEDSPTAKLSFYDERKLINGDGSVCTLGPIEVDWLDFCDLVDQATFTVNHRVDFGDGRIGTVYHTRQRRYQVTA